VIGAVGEDVGSVSNGGFVHVLYGNSSGLAGTSEFSFDQNTSGIAGTSESNDYLGRRFWIGDWNDDGYQDLVAFVPGDGCGTNTKGFHIVYGSSSGLTTSGNSIACAVGIGPDVF
jgi:hypothetical protein